MQITISVIIYQAQALYIILKKNHSYKYIWNFCRRLNIKIYRNKGFAIYYTGKAYSIYFTNVHRKYNVVYNVKYIYIYTRRMAIITADIQRDVIVIMHVKHNFQFNMQIYTKVSSWLLYI